MIAFCLYLSFISPPNFFGIRIAVSRNPRKCCWNQFCKKLSISPPHESTVHGEWIQKEVPVLQYNVPALFSVTSLSLSKTEEKWKTPFVSTHYISAVRVPNESPVCGSFQQKMVTGLANWTWLGSLWSLIVSMTDWGWLGQNCTALTYIETHALTERRACNPVCGLNGDGIN